MKTVILRHAHRLPSQSPTGRELVEARLKNSKQCQALDILHSDARSDDSVQCNGSGRSASA